MTNNEQKDQEKALKHIKEVLAIYKNQEDKLGMAEAMNIAGILYINKRFPGGNY